MRLHNFFVETEIKLGEKLELTDVQLVHQLKQVFRYRSGDKIILINGSGFNYVVEIISLTKEKVEVLVLSSEKNNIKPRLEVHLYASLIKKDNFEWVVQKATELGVASITGIISERTEKKDINIERIIKIIKEASEQSGRGTLPVFKEIVSFEDSLKQAVGKKVLVQMEQERLSRDEYLDDSVVSLFVGPEGGWSDEELLLSNKYDVSLRGMGAQTLRAETATISALSVILI